MNLHTECNFPIEFPRTHNSRLSYSSCLYSSLSSQWPWNEFLLSSFPPNPRNRNFSSSSCPLIELRRLRNTDKRLEKVVFSIIRAVSFCAKDNRTDGQEKCKRTRNIDFPSDTFRRAAREYKYCQRRTRTVLICCYTVVVLRFSHSPAAWIKLRCKYLYYISEVGLCTSQVTLEITIHCSPSRETSEMGLWLGSIKHGHKLDFHRAKQILSFHRERGI